MAVRTSTRARLRLPRRALWVVADDVLVAQVRAGSRGAFEAIYDRHHAGILSFCRHMLGSREEAEDAVQHTFVAAYQGLLVGEREIAIKAWLYTIARNRCLSVLRARREHAALDDAAAAVPETAGLSAEVERREDLRALLGDLQRLPDDQRAALVLSELAAHSHDEIAAILDVPTTKVKALVFQAREGLMNRRTAREADCAEIREQLTVLRGSARRGLLRHHIAQCEACHAFAAEVRAQQARMALLLPVAPTLALKHSSLSAAFAVGQGGAAATGGAGALGGGAMASAKVLGTKVLISLAVTGAGGGYLAVHELRSETRSSSAPAQATAAPPARGASASAARPAVAAAGRAPAGRSSAAQPCPSGPGGACAARTPGAPDGPGLPNAAQSHDATPGPASAGRLPGAVPAVRAPGSPTGASATPAVPVGASSIPGGVPAAPGAPAAPAAPAVPSGAPVLPARPSGAAPAVPSAPSLAAPAVPPAPSVRPGPAIPGAPTAPAAPGVPPVPASPEAPGVAPAPPAPPVPLPG